MMRKEEMKKETNVKLEKLVNYLEQVESISITGNSVYVGSITRQKNEEHPQKMWAYEKYELGTIDMYDTYELVEEIIPIIDGIETGNNGITDIKFNLFKKEETTEEVPEKSPEEKFLEDLENNNNNQFTFLNVNFETEEIKVLSLNLAFRNVLNMGYFQRAVSFNMFRVLEHIHDKKIADCKKVISDKEKALDELSPINPKYNKLSSEIEDKKQMMQSIINTWDKVYTMHYMPCDFKKYEIKMFTDDKFANIVAVALFADNAKNLTSFLPMFCRESLRLALQKYYNSQSKGLDSTAERKEVKNVIDSFWSHYCTEKNNWYNNLWINCNNSDFEKVYTLVGSLIKRNSSTKIFDSTDCGKVDKNMEKIQFQITGLLIERIQKNIGISTSGKKAD